MSGLQLRPSVGAEEVRLRLAEVRRRIVRAGGDLGRVRIVAVTKGFDATAPLTAIAAGLTELGENYADELVEKATVVGAVEKRPEWHFLGAIQRNKLARLAAHVSVYQGVDRLDEAVAIAKRAPGAAVFIEVDTTGRAGRGGVAPSQVGSLVAAIAHLDLAVRGLMTVAPPGDLTAAEAAFNLTRELVVDLGLEEASMGMTDDLEVAVAAGSTMVRVGRALFGQREDPPKVAEAVTQ